MDIGNEIKRVRAEKGFNQVDLARAANIAQGRVSMIENNKYLDMSEEAVAPVLDVLGVSYAEITARAQTSDERQTKLDTIIEKFDRITEVLFAGNGIVIETKPKLINQLGGATLLPVEFSPVLTVELLEPVGDYVTGDVMFFSRISNMAEIKENDYLVAETEAGMPQVFLASEMSQFPQPKGKGIRVLKKL